MNEFSFCPDCDATIGMARPILGNELLCPDCGVLLEIIGIMPLQFSWAMEEIDIDDDFDDYDDYDDLNSDELVPSGTGRR